MIFAPYTLDKDGYDKFVSDMRISAQYIKTRRGVDVIMYVEKLFTLQWIFAQAALESANFQDSAWTQYGNCFGMHAPNSRKLYYTTFRKGNEVLAGYRKNAIPEIPGGFRIGSSFLIGGPFRPVASMVDYLLRQKQFAVRPEFIIADTVASGYAEVSDYAARWKKRHDEIFGTYQNPDYTRWYRGQMAELNTLKKQGKVSTNKEGNAPGLISGGVFSNNFSLIFLAVLAGLVAREIKKKK